MTEEIHSLQNQKVKKWTLLHKKKYRDESGLFLVEGEHLVEEALAAGAAEAILTDNVFQEYPSLIRVTPEIMTKLSQNVSGAHLIAVCRQLKKEVHAAERLLLLDRVQDPGNLGTLVRTAVSFGFDAVICSKDCCDLYNDKVIRSTQGALFHIPVIYTALPAFVRQLQKEGTEVIATTLEDACPLRELPHKEKMSFILGNEGQGVSKELQQLADKRLRIEMHGFESLNVAVAGGIVMYRYRKQ